MSAREGEADPLSEGATDLGETGPAAAAPGADLDRGGTDLGTAGLARAITPADLNSGATGLGIAGPAAAAPPDDLDAGRTDLGAAAAPAPAATAAPPRRAEEVRGKSRIGLYEVLEELGRGGMGAVYKAWHPLRRRHIALKVIKPDVADSERFQKLRDLFLREAGILMSVTHENVVGCYDANEADHEGKPVLYMALELLEGESLSGRIAQGPLPLADVVRVSEALARALEALHNNAKRILHRDLKPANVFLTKDGGIKLLDFGLAGVTDWKLTQVSMFAAGSRPYMSPEQFEGLRFCTERSDLYSLGVTIFQMVTGRCPFEANTDQGFLEAHRDRSPPLFLDVAPGLEKGPLLDALQNIVTRLIAKIPDERYQSAREVLDALERAEGGGEITKPRVTRPEALRLRRAILRGAVFALLLVLAGVVGVTVLRSSVPRRIAAAQEKRDAWDLEGAQEILRAVLADAPGNQEAQALAADIASRLSLRSPVLARSAAARRARAERRPKDGADEAAAAHDGARRSGVFSPAELEALAAETAEAETERANTFGAAAGEAAAALGAGDLARADAAAGAAEALARIESERARASALRREHDGRATLAEGRAELDSGGVEAARGKIADVRRRLPELEPLAAALEAEVSAAARILEDLKAAEEAAARGGDAARGAEAARRAREALAAGGAALERRVGRTAAQARDVEAAIAPRLCDALLDEAVRLAAGLLKGGKPEEVEEAARRALRALPPAEAEALRALARALPADRAARGHRAARAALREGLRPAPRAERGYLIAEHAAAARERRKEERLVIGVEGVSLGSDDAGLGNPVHVVSLAPFYIDATETDAQAYADFLKAKGGRPPEGWKDARPPAGRERHPVRGIGFEEAKTYAAFAGKRMPFADEWEAAASVDPLAPRGRRRPYPWGEKWFDGIAPAGAAEPRATGSLPLDESPWGCLDMGGGVQEWTVETDAEGREVPALQGGSFLMGSYPQSFHGAQRSRPATGGDVDRFEDAGVRCARDAPVPDLEEFAREP